MSSESSKSMALVRKSAIRQTENLQGNGFDLSPWLLALEEEIQPVKNWIWEYCTSAGLGASPSPRSSVIRFKGQTGSGVTPKAEEPTWAPCLQLSPPFLWAWSQAKSCELPAGWCAPCPGSLPIVGCRRERTICDKTLHWGLLWVGWLVRVTLSHFLSLFAVKICSKPILLKFAKLLLHIIPFTSWSKCALDQNLSFYTWSSACDMSRS